MECGMKSKNKKGKINIMFLFYLLAKNLLPQSNQTKYNIAGMILGLCNTNF